MCRSWAVVVTAAAGRRAAAYLTTAITAEWFMGNNQEATHQNRRLLSDFERPSYLHSQAAAAGLRPGRLGDDGAGWEAYSRAREIDVDVGTKRKSSRGG